MYTVRWGSMSIFTVGTPLYVVPGVCGLCRLTTGPPSKAFQRARCSRRLTVEVRAKVVECVAILVLGGVPLVCWVSKETGFPRVESSGHRIAKYLARGREGRRRDTV